MLYHLLYPLNANLILFNVFRYISFRAIMATLTALMISFLLGRPLIDYLREFQIGQMVRDDGPQTHLEKTGTPTMGGVTHTFCDDIFLSTVGKVGQHLCMGCAGRHSFLWSYRFSGRLFEDPQAESQRPERQAEIRTPVTYRRAGRVVSLDGPIIQDYSRSPLFQKLSSRSWFLVPYIRRPGNRWGFKRCKFDGRPRWSSHRACNDMRRHLPFIRLYCRPPETGPVSPGAIHTWIWRTLCCLRSNAWSGNGVPLVQRLPGGSLYGRRRIIISGRISGSCGGSDETRNLTSYCWWGLCD